MNHDYIDENQVVERYVMGQLPRHQVAEFEEHFLGCSECPRRLELAERLHRGLRGVAAEEVERAVRGRVWAALRRLAGRRWWPAAALTAAAIAGVLLLRAESQRLRLARELARVTEPQARSAVVHLDAERSGAGAPATRIRLGSDHRWILLQTAELEGEAAAGPLRAILEGPGGEVVWRAEGLAAGADGSVSLGVHSSFLVPGDYRLRLEKQAASPVASARFRVETEGR